MSFDPDKFIQKKSSFNPDSFLEKRAMAEATKKAEQGYDENKPSKLESFAAGTSQGALREWFDEFAAKGSSLFSGEDYETEKLRVKDQLQRAKEAKGREDDCGLIDILGPRAVPFDWFNVALMNDLFGQFKAYIS